MTFASALSHADALMTALGEHQRSTRPAREAVAAGARARILAGEDREAVMSEAMARLREIDAPFDEWRASLSRERAA